MRLFYLFLVTSSICFSQAEASHWYFGNGAGLIFDVNSGTVDSTDAANFTINTNEGCSSISDFNGDLLFYTDGRNIWDKTHTVMPNANYNSGDGLMGDPSSTSSGLIIPKPGNPNQYYVFTVDEPHHQNSFAYPNQGPADINGNPEFSYDSGGSVPEADDGFNNGLAYSLVDMTLNSGNGDVVSSEKNIQLMTYDPSDQVQASYKCAEKITAVEHSDGQSYWVVTQFIDKFYSFRIQASGVNTTPVVTTTTPLISVQGYRRNGIGYIKASPDGNKIAVCHRQNGNTQGQNSNNSGSVWLYDFDNETGVVSNPINLNPSSEPYGIEFSPESSKLYVSDNDDVIQFDLDVSNPAATITTVHSGFSFIAALQLGPDGKIYIANTGNSSALDIINSPDEIGVLCDYSQSGIALASGTNANLGLPPFIQSFFLASIVFENSCVNQNTQFEISTTQPFDSILWDFGDGIGTSTDSSPIYSYTTPGTFQVNAEISSGSETNTFSREIIISLNPNANSVDDLIVCDSDADGISSFDFTQPLAQVLGSQNPADLRVTFHNSLTDAETAINPLSLPYQNSNSSESIFIRIENINNSNCYNTAEFELNVYNTPIANPILNHAFCDDLADGDDANGQTQINLTYFNSDILDVQDSSLYDVSYYLSQSDADLGINPIVSPYYNTTAFAYELFARVDNLLNTDCYATTEFIVNIYPTPTANIPSDLEVCDDDQDGIIAFDFIETQTQIFGTQDPTAYNLTFHSSLNEAETNVNPISLPYQNTSDTETIFARIENSTNTSCFATTAFQITIFDSPIANTVASFEVCDDLNDGDDTNGRTEITLTDFDAQVTATQDPSLFDISYHESLEEAQGNTNPLSSPYYNSNPFSYQIFVRIQNTLKTDCFDTSEFTVNVNPIPQALDANFIQCDQDGLSDGLTTFNLTQVSTDISNGIPDRTVQYYTTLNDAENGINELSAAAYINSVNPQIIFGKVTDDTNACFGISELTLEVSLTSGTDANLTACDDDGIEDGFINFDLDQASPLILNGLSSDYELEYYETYQDALLEQNPLSSSYTNTSPFNHTLFARIENNNQCYGINELSLAVLTLPQLDNSSDNFICVDSDSGAVFIDSGVIGNPLDFNYLWSNGETTEQIQITSGGNYQVTITNSNNCSQTNTITIVNSNIATIESIEINDGGTSNTVSVVATGEGDYEYALDDIDGPYQDDNNFYNVSAGFHTVYVRDKNDCGIADEIISVIGFPNFFTPNGDGYNDTWHVYGINTPSQAGSEIYIFDRYGKLLKQMAYNSPGWNGIYNGNLMPTSDYWFYIKLNDNRIFRGHFTLKR